MLKQTFQFKIKSQSQLRPRFARRGNIVISYDPISVKNYKDTIKILAKQQMKQKGLNPLNMPLTVAICFDIKPPKSYTKKKTKALLESEYHYIKPDIDNLAKAILDALNGVIWIDDSIITSLHLRKKWHKEDKITIIISTHEDC